MVAFRAKRYLMGSGLNGDGYEFHLQPLLLMKIWTLCWDKHFPELLVGALSIIIDIQTNWKLMSTWNNGEESSEFFSGWIGENHRQFMVVNTAVKEF